MEASIVSSTEVSAIERKGPDIISQVNSLVVKTHDDERAGVEYIRVCKSFKKEVHDLIDDPTDKAHKSWKAMVALRTKLLEPFETAETIARGKVTAFQDAQEALRRAEQARLEELARKDQQKRLDAATKRVNALLEKTGDINEQIAALEAEQQGPGLSDEEAAAIDHRLNMLRVKRDNLNQAVLEKTAEAERAQYVAPVPVVAAPAPKAQGASSRVKKKAVVQNAMQLIKAVAAGQAPVEAISFNMAVLDKLVNAGAIVPGVGFTEDRILSVR